MSIEHRQHGITLVELLVVITLMAIVTALIIPRVRLVNKERNLREAARVVGSIFSAGSNDAVSGGVAGVLIERNPNFVEATDDGNNTVYFAGSRLYLLRGVPDYTGDEDQDDPLKQATIDIDNSDPNRPVVRCRIPLPLDHDPAGGIAVVRQNDYIRLGSVRYLINSPPQIETFNNIDVLRFNLRFDDDVDPTNAFDFSRPDLFSGIPAPRSGKFVIERQPRKVESSVVELPAGHIIDLRYSGPLDLGDANMDGVHEGQDDNDYTFTKFGLKNDTSDLVIVYDASGAVNTVQFDNQSVVFGQTLFLYITEYDANEADVNNSVSAFDMSRNILSKPETLWVTVNNSTGGVNIAYNAPPAPGGQTGFDVISDSRSISRGRTNAAQ